MRYCVLLLSVVALGCTGQSVTTKPAPIPGTSPTAGSSTKSAGANEMALSPENTKIEFVGTHVGPVPDPEARQGSFEEFEGKAVLSDGMLEALSVEIQMASVQTGKDKLNSHLQNEDFFSVREYPTAKFESTSITKNEDGSHLVTGNLTLHSKTNEIQLPAQVEVVDGKLEMSAVLVLDRTEFGMDKMTDKVNKEVSLSISIGKS